MLQQHIRISSFHPSIGIGLIHGADASPSLWRFQIDHLSALHTKWESLSFLLFEVSVTKKSRKPVILPYYQNAKQLMGQFPITSLEHIAKCLSRRTGGIAPRDVHPKRRVLHNWSLRMVDFIVVGHSWGNHDRRDHVEKVLPTRIGAILNRNLDWKEVFISYLKYGILTTQWKDLCNKWSATVLLQLVEQNPILEILRWHSAMMPIRRRSHKRSGRNA